LSERISSFGEFWPFYLNEHAHPLNRALHIFGTSLGVACWVMAFLCGSWRWFFAGPVCGYAFAWIGHAFVEGNRPATFTYPIYSFFGDVLMFLCFLFGTLDSQVRRHVRGGRRRDA
jgi:hypothetical protein